jgi:hypothetical protein
MIGVILDQQDFDMLVVCPFHFSINITMKKTLFSCFMALLQSMGVYYKENILADIIHPRLHFLAY